MDNNAAVELSNATLHLYNLVSWIGFTLLFALGGCIQNGLKKGKKRWTRELREIYPLEELVNKFAEILGPWVRFFDWLMFSLLLIFCFFAYCGMSEQVQDKNEYEFYRWFIFFIAPVSFTVILALKERAGLPYHKFIFVFQRRAFFIRMFRMYHGKK